MPIGMRARFGGAAQAPDFGPIAELAGATLPMPKRDDGLKTLCQKMSDLRQILQKGASVAVATGLTKATGHGTTAVKEFARGIMSVTELTQYDDWKSGVRLSEFEPATSKEPMTVWEGSEKRLDQWVQGLRKMYEDQTLDRGNACWYAKHAPFLVPTIKAHLKLLHAHNAIPVQDRNLSPQELAECQTLRKVMAESNFAVQEFMRKVHGYTAEIDSANQTMLARLRYYELLSL